MIVSTTLRLRTLVTSVLLWLALVPPVSAQGPKQEDAHSAAAGPPNLSLGTIAGLSGEGGGAFQGILEAGVKDKSATAALGWKNGQDVFRLTFKGPVSAKSKEAIPLTLDGLNSGAAFELSANRLSWRGPDSDEQAEFAAICKQYLPGQACNVSALPAGTVHKRAEQLLHLSDIPWYMGVSGGAGRTTFDFLEGKEFAEKSEHHMDWSGTVRGGYFSPTLGFLIASLGYQRAFKAGGDTVNLCRPVEGTTATTCSEAVLKGPKESTSTVATLETRRFLSRGTTVVPMIQRDLKKKITSVVIPVYFLKDAEGSAIGGLRGGWRSDTKTFSLSLFVGGAVTLTPP